MKRDIMKIGLIVLSAVFIVSVLYSGPVHAENDFLFSPMSNSIWVLKKSTRKLIFIQFQKKEEIWKSNAILIPPEFNPNECGLFAVGSRGTAVHLYDKSSGLITFYDVEKDHSVRTFPIVNTSGDLN